MRPGYPVLLLVSNGGFTSARWTRGIGGGLRQPWRGRSRRGSPGSITRSLTPSSSAAGTQCPRQMLQRGGSSTTNVGYHPGFLSLASTGAAHQGVGQVAGDEATRGAGGVGVCLTTYRKCACRREVFLSDSGQTVSTETLGIRACINSARTRTPQTSRHG